MADGWVEMGQTFQASGMSTDADFCLSVASCMTFFRCTPIEVLEDPEIQKMFQAMRTSNAPSAIRICETFMLALYRQVCIAYRGHFNLET